MADAYRYPPFNNAKPEPIWSDDSDYFIPIVSSIGSGPKGDTFTYEDLSPQQITQIGEMAIAAGAKGDKGDKGDTGDPAGFDEITASVDNSIGTPSVVVTESGPNEAKNIDFAFHNLKGDTFTFDDLTPAQLLDLRSGINGLALQELFLPNGKISDEDADACFHSVNGIVQSKSSLTMYNDYEYIHLVFKNGLLLTPREWVWSVTEFGQNYTKVALSLQQGIADMATPVESDIFEMIQVSVKVPSA